MNMKAMVLEKTGGPLVLQNIPVGKPGPCDVLIRISVCGVCRTDLHILHGELYKAKLPLIMGHEIVGTVVALGENARAFSIGERVGVPWLGQTCGTCGYCMKAKENLCDEALFTGYTKNGGYAEYAVADEKYCFRIPSYFDDVSAAPLLCAGLIGYRAFAMVPSDAVNIGLYGFGAAAHIIAQIAVFLGKRVYAFTKPHDTETQDFARSLGAVWAADSSQMPPEKLDAAIIFAPMGALVPLALRACDKGATVVCGGIHMSDIPSFSYDILWGERVIRSVANLTRKDAEDGLALAAKVPVKIRTTAYGLTQANVALDAVEKGKHDGAVVLVI